MLAMELRESKVCALLRVRGMQSMPAQGRTQARSHKQRQQQQHNTSMSKSQAQLLTPHSLTACLPATHARAFALRPGAKLAQQRELITHEWLQSRHIHAYSEQVQPCLAHQ
jgi:hypothetical protein